MAISMNAVNAEKRRQAEQARLAPPAAAVVDAAPTPRQLDAAAAMRRRDGITRAAALTRVRELSEDQLQALLDASSPHAPREEGPELEQEVTKDAKVEPEAAPAPPFVELPEFDGETEPDR